MTHRTSLLEYADRLLDGQYGLGARGPRTAALLARLAFEEWLDEQSASWASASPGYRPTTKSQLVVLSALRGVEVGEKANRAWNRLSRAVHHHAYELQPSAAEIRHLVTQVRGLTAGVGH
jgi:hypothetical protein